MFHTTKKKKTKNNFGSILPHRFLWHLCKIRDKSKNVTWRSLKNIYEKFFRYVADAIDPMEHWFSRLIQNAMEAGLFGASTGAILLISSLLLKVLCMVIYIVLIFFLNKILRLLQF